jgi:hypothetical protein
LLAIRPLAKRVHKAYNIHKQYPGINRGNHHTEEANALEYLFFFLTLALNFAISWANARAAGKIWSESKEIGGMLRVNAVVAYILAIAGFTMVYGCILALLMPHLLPILVEGMTAEMLWSSQQLAADILYILVAAFVVPLGFFVWFQNAVSFWRRRTLSEGLRLGWNTYAQVRNTVSVARNAPSALGRIAKALFGGKKKGNAIVIMAAIFIVLLAVLGGYFTASTIMKNADYEYDLFEGMRPMGEPPPEWRYGV